MCCVGLCCVVLSFAEFCSVALCGVVFCCVALCCVVLGCVEVDSNTSTLKCSLILQGTGDSPRLNQGDSREMIL